MKKKEFQTQLGERVRLMRLRAGMVQGELAERVNISRTQVTMIETGRVMGSLWVIATFCQACKFDIWDLLNPNFKIETTRISFCCNQSHSSDYGACDSFGIGGNGRCVYCDHAESCHPGSGQTFNTPLGVGLRTEY